MGDRDLGRMRRPLKLLIIAWFFHISLAMLRKLGLRSSSCSYVPCAISATMGWVAEHVFGRSEYAEKGQHGAQADDFCEHTDQHQTH